MDNTESEKFILCPKGWALILLVDESGEYHYLCPIGGNCEDCQYDVNLKISEEIRKVSTRKGW